MVTEVDANLLLKFETEEAEKNHIVKLKYWEKKLCEQAKNDFRKLRFNIGRYLSLVCSILYLLYHKSLRSRLKIEIEYWNMINQNKFDMTVLHKLIRKICNR